MSGQTEERARELLTTAVGPDAEFRDDQLEAILALVDDRERVLVVQRTGWGKSLVYFVATKLRREAGAGPTVLISPLLSLMRDQERAAVALGLEVARVDSTPGGQLESLEEWLAADEIDLLMITPERLANERFRTTTIPAIRKGIGLFVVDEAHCISDWGYDFRPDYQRIERLIDRLPPGVPVLATTATANRRVEEDVARQLGAATTVLRGPLGRDSLRLQVIELPDQADRLAWLASYLAQVEGSGIVYTLTVRDAIKVSAWLAGQGIDAPAYYGGADDRPALEEALMRNEVKALVSTVALGMGFDKPDLSFVVHFQRPASVIAYYQQVGRAGRGVDRAEVVLLTGTEDEAIADYFIGNAFPPEHELTEVVGALEGVDDASQGELLQAVNLSEGSVKRALKFLELEGAAVRDTGRWSRTPNQWSPDTSQSQRVTMVRRAEQKRMRDYTETGDCLMAFLTGELGEPDPRPCGRCANCTGAFTSAEVDPGLAHEAVRFLRRSHRPIKPKQLWPPGLEQPSTIPAELRVEQGLALSIYGDSGWGRLVQRDKSQERHFVDALVNATAEMVQEWSPANLGWVAAVPSLRRQDLVPDFAERLAARLGLPYRPVLKKTRNTAQQKTMQNSYQQARNAQGAFEVVAHEVETGPVLLVDDMVDSGWTLTECGFQLRAAGAGPVYPVVLAETTSRR